MTTTAAVPALLGDILARRAPVPTDPATLAALMCDTPGNRLLDLYDLLAAQTPAALCCWNTAGDLVLRWLKEAARAGEEMEER